MNYQAYINRELVIDEKSFDIINDLIESWYKLYPRNDQWAYDFYMTWGTNTNLTYED